MTAALCIFIPNSNNATCPTWTDSIVTLKSQELGNSWHVPKNKNQIGTQNEHVLIFSIESGDTSHKFE
jgi:hypothetical protein